MLKRIAVMLSAFASVILIAVLLFTSVQYCINDSTFINNEYTKLGLAHDMGMSNADLVHACTVLIDYMEGKADSIDVEVTINGEKTLMFDQEQEVEHMRDVQKLYAMCENYRDTGLLVMLLLLVLAAVLSFRTALNTIAKGYIWGFFLMLLVLGFVGTWAMLDFNSFWNAFHESLFWNDKWLFDPTTSRMINMLPATFFADLVSNIFLYAGIAMLVLLAAAIFTLIRLKKRRERAEELEAEKRALPASEERKRRAHAEKKNRTPDPIEADEARRAAIRKKKAAARKKRAAEEAASTEATARKKKKRRDDGAARSAEAPVRKKKKRPAPTDADADFFADDPAEIDFDEPAVQTDMGEDPSDPA